MSWSHCIPIISTWKNIINLTSTFSMGMVGERLVNPSPSKARLRRSLDPVLAAPRYNSSSAASARRANAWRRWWGRGSPGGNNSWSKGWSSPVIRLDGNAKANTNCKKKGVFAAPFNHDVFFGEFCLFNFDWLLGFHSFRWCIDHPPCIQLTIWSNSHAFADLIAIFGRFKIMSVGNPASDGWISISGPTKSPFFEVEATVV